MKNFSLVLLFVLTFFFESCAQEKQYVKVDEIPRVVQQYPNQIIDVRTPEEYQVSHIKGAMNINVLDRNFRNAVDTLARNQRYYLYCRSGNRTEKAYELMTEAGFDSLALFRKGMKDYPEVIPEVVVE